MLRVTVERMESLGVSFGFGARDVLCLAFDRAQSTIKAEFYDLSDRNVIASINAAAQRPVTVGLKKMSARSLVCSGSLILTSI